MVPERWRDGWRWVLAILVVGQFAVPFAVLLGYAIKRRPRPLSWVAAWLLVVHWIDLFWVVGPPEGGGGPWVGWEQVPALAAVLGLAVAYAAWRLGGGWRPRAGIPRGGSPSATTRHERRTRASRSDAGARPDGRPASRGVVGGDRPGDRRVRGALVRRHPAGGAGEPGGRPRRPWGSAPARCARRTRPRRTAPRPTRPRVPAWTGGAGWTAMRASWPCRSTRR